MAKFRLLSAHYLDVNAGTWLPGDKEEFDAGKGDERGTIVGDGTEYPIKWPTLDMVALDEEAEMLLERERQRLITNDGSRDPVEELAMDGFEQNYIPGSNKRRKPALPDGSPVAVKNA
jgi:hypothetical protein